MSDSSASGRLSNRLLLTIAIICGVAAAILILRAPPIRQVEVAAADRTIPARESVSRANLKATKVSLAEYGDKQKTLIPWSMVALVEGRRAKVEIAAGSALDLSAFMSTEAQDGESQKPGVITYLSTQIEGERGDMRAVAIPCDAVNSFNYALEPGDVVDVLQPIKSGLNSTRSLYNRKVLAVGSRTSQGWMTPAADGGRYTSITLLVTRDEADILTQMFSGSFERPFFALHRRVP